MSKQKSCPVCDYRKSIETVHELYVKCINCQAVYQNANIEKVEDYYATIQAAPNYTRQTGNYKNYIKRTSYLYTNDALIFDIGAGDGTFLNIVKKRLRTSKIGAIESSPIARETIKSKNIPIYEYEKVGSTTPKIVYSFQVLEHIDKPNDFIRNINLQVNDYLILTSPATDSKAYKSAKREWRSFSPSHHLVLYNQKSLRSLLERNGLSLIKYNFCYSGSNNHNWILNLFQNLKKTLIWIVRLLIKGYKPRPKFHGENSFLAICKKQK